MSAHTPERICWAIDLVSGLKAPCQLQELSVTFTGKDWSSRYLFGDLFSNPWPTFKLNSPGKQLHTLSLKKVYTNWTECTFDTLFVLRLSDVHALGINKFEHIMATSHMLQAIDLTRICLRGSRSEREPMTLSNLKLLRICYMEHFLISSVLDILTAGTYNVELYVDKDSLLIQYQRRPKLAEGISKLQYILSKKRNITALGIGYTSELLRKETLSSIVNPLLDLESVRLEDILLDRDNVLAVENIIKTFPRIKTIQTRRIGAISVGAFKGMIENCPTERIELIDCWVITNFWEGKKYLIEPGTPLYE
ncbi:hypothetical protein B0J17DRAFT_626484 [Rhizoctonia solani]|nr:hypothetical protein B0J17DRAFT_626484 [Rhizoctonia solani]